MGFLGVSIFWERVMRRFVVSVMLAVCVVVVPVINPDTARPSAWFQVKAS